MPTAHLQDRGVVKVSGPDAKTFLDGLVTCDIDKVSPQAARLGALLTPQGKILFDFIVFQAPSEAEAYYLDVAKAAAPDLAKRLGFYKLRAKVIVEDRSDALAVVAGWDGAREPLHGAVVAADDPRLPALGWRAIVASPLGGEVGAQSAPGEGGAPGAGEAAYHAHRIALGIPEGGKDFPFGDAFPHEAMMDQLRGVDFDKGCYVGQEVVSRMQHRGTARTRIVPVVYSDGAAPEAGADVVAGERTLGKTGSSALGRGLVTIRLDRAQEALQAGEAIRAGGVPVRLEKRDWIGFPVPGAG
jgi:folate-binding protein YgfZ